MFPGPPAPPARGACGQLAGAGQVCTAHTELVVSNWPSIFRKVNDKLSWKIPLQIVDCDANKLLSAVGLPTDPNRPYCQAPVCSGRLWQTQVCDGGGHAVPGCAVQQRQGESRHAGPAERLSRCTRGWCGWPQARGTRHTATTPRRFTTSSPAWRSGDHLQATSQSAVPARSSSTRPASPTWWWCPRTTTCLPSTPGRGTSTAGEDQSRGQRV